MTPRASMRWARGDNGGTVRALEHARDKIMVDPQRLHRQRVELARGEQTGADLFHGC